MTAVRSADRTVRLFERFESVGRPLLLFGGSEDGTCEFVDNQQAPYDLAQRPRGLVKIVGAGHLDFSNLCEVPVATLLVNDGCDPPKIDPREVQSRTRTLSAAFAHRYLDDDVRYDAFLAPSAVVALGRLDYWWDP